MKSKIEVIIDNEDDARRIAAGLRKAGHQVQGPYYTNRYGAPQQHAGVGKEDKVVYPAMTESEIDHD